MLIENTVFKLNINTKYILFCSYVTILYFINKILYIQHCTYEHCPYERQI